MNPDKRDVLAVLRSELTFVEQGGYARANTPGWWPTLIFEDSPACPNYNDRSRPHACSECALLELVPESKRSEPSPCRFIPITVDGETIDDFYHFGTQQELEATLKRWLRVKIGVMEIRRALAKNDLLRTSNDRWLLPMR